MKRYVLFLLTVLSSFSLMATNQEPPKSEEKPDIDGWIILFDGSDMDAWRGFGKEAIGSAWKIDNGTLHLSTEGKLEGMKKIPDGGDIITKETFDDFELHLEWKISPCGNSGIMYYVQSSDDFEFPWLTGPEMQVLDNDCHPDASIAKHRAGDLYDLISCSEETVKKAGEWNKVKIVSKDGLLQHWLNGTKVVEVQLWNDAWKEMLAKSKFGEMESFGIFQKGHIALQDHDDAVWYRNIKIKRL